MVLLRPTLAPSLALGRLLTRFWPQLVSNVIHNHVLLWHELSFQALVDTIVLGEAMSTPQGSQEDPSVPLPIDEIVPHSSETDPVPLQEEIIETFLR